MYVLFVGVYPVAILSEVFCSICSLLMFVWNVMVTIMWKPTRMWVLLWRCMQRVSFPLVSPMWSS